MSDTAQIQIRTKKHGTKIGIVDAIDADLTKIRWHAYEDYVQRVELVGGKQTTILIHRVIMARVLDRELGRWEFVDHKDNNPLNNRRENLQLATMAQNNKKRRISSRNTSGYKGVTWNKECRKWSAQICSDRKVKHLGTFSDIKDAARAYNEAAVLYHGEFAYLNIIPDEDAS